MGSIPYKWLVAIAFVAGFFMDLMDVTIVNVTLPTFARDFHAQNTTLEWVVNAYLLSLAVWIPASGWIGDKFGTKKTFLFALMMFTLGSVLCGLATNIQMLIFFRVLQGIGGGMMTPVGVTMLFRAFPPQERAEASSILAIPSAIAPALGPVLGGFLTDFANWRWIFFVNVPVGIAAFFFGLRFLKEYKDKTAGGFDYAGFILSAISFVLILYALSLGPTEGWTSLPILLSGIFGIIFLIILIAVETRIKIPILHFKLFNERLFRTSNIIMFFAFACWLGFLFILPLFLQDLRGLSAFDSGLTTFPQALGWLSISFFTNNLYKKLGPKLMITFGLIGAILLTGTFIFMDTNTNLWIIRIIMFFRGFSMGFAVIPVQAAAFANITPQETGRASALFNTNRQIASSFGVAVLGTILFQFFTMQSSTFSNKLFAYHISFIGATVLGVIAILFAFTIKDKDAAATMR